jgi:hypothetical protein
MQPSNKSSANNAMIPRSNVTSKLPFDEIMRRALTIKPEKPKKKSKPKKKP